MIEIRTETKDNGSWSQYLEVGTYEQDRFGDQVWKRAGYAKKFSGLTVHTKTDGRGAAAHTRYIIEVPDGFAYVIRRTTNPGGGDRSRKYEVLYEPMGPMG
jgi:hypothetical protein